MAEQPPQAQSAGAAVIPGAPAASGSLQQPDGNSKVQARIADAQSPEELMSLGAELAAADSGVPAQEPPPESAPVPQGGQPEGEQPAAAPGKEVGLDDPPAVEQPKPDGEQAPAPGEGEQPAPTAEEAQQAEEAAAAETARLAQEAAASESKQYRLHLPKNDKVGARAILIQKRNKDLTMEECLDRAKKELGIPLPGAAPVDDGKPKLPDTIEGVRALRTKLRADMLAAQRGVDVDGQAAIQDQLFQLEDHERVVVQQAATQESAATQQYNGQFEASKAKAADLYQFVQDPNSPAAKMMMEIDAELQANDDPLYFSPDKPLKLAQMAAKELNIRPKAKPISPPAKPTGVRQGVPPAGGPKKTVPVVASGDSRTVAKTTQSGQQAEAIQRLGNAGEIEDYLRNLGVEGL